MIMYELGLVTSQHNRYNITLISLAASEDVHHVRAVARWPRLLFLMLSVIRAGAQWSPTTVPRASVQALDQ